MLRYASKHRVARIDKIAAMQTDSSLSIARKVAAPRGLTLLTLCLAVLVAQIDTAVVNLATRAIGADLKAGIGALQWIVDSYNLVYAVLLLTGGLLADLYGPVPYWETGGSPQAVAAQ